MRWKEVLPEQGPDDARTAFVGPAMIAFLLRT